MDYSRMGGGVYGPDPEQMALISRLKDQNAAPPPVRMPAPAPPDAAPAPPISNAYNPTTNPRGTSLPDANVVLQGPAGQSRTIPNPRYQPDVVTKDQVGNLPTPASPSAQGRGPTQAPSGWDNAKWNDPNKHDPKYDVGHILQSVAVNGKISGAQVAAALPEIQKLYPGATFDGKDALTIPGFDPIDVIRGADAGGGTGDLQWYVPGGGGGGGAMPPMQTPPDRSTEMPIPGMQNPGMNDDFWQKLMAALQAGQDPNRIHEMGQPTAQALTSQLRG